MGKQHDTVANRLAAKHGTGYNKGQGADVQAQRLTIEVETERTVKDAGRQLRGYKHPVYIAGTNAKTVEKAVEHFKGTTIGVMDQQGKVVKRSTRGRR